MAGLSKRASSIKPSPTLALTAKVKSLKAKGVDIVGFEAGEPDFDTPRYIKQAAIKAIEKGFTKYTPASGIDELKKAVCERLKAKNGLEYEPAQILISCGAKHCLYNVCQAVLEEGDEVIIISPYWVSYVDMVTLAGAVPVIVDTKEEEEFRINIDTLKKALTPKTKAIIINSPSNPTGAIYEKKDLEEIANIVLEKDLFVISDEIYDEIIYDGYTSVSIASLGKEIKDHTIVINGVSKTYSMTGWRIGYAAGPQQIIKAMSNIQSQSTSNPCSISQMAALEALRGPQDKVKQMVEEFDKRRRYIVERLRDIPGVSCFEPRGAFYIFPNLSSFYGKNWQQYHIKDSTSIAEYLLDTVKVGVVPGIAFGADNYVRISYATSLENIKKGIDRIEEALRRLK